MSAALPADAHPTSAQARPVEATDGDREKLFRSLVDAHQQRLLRFIIRNIGNSSDAEDLTQQAFVEAVRSYQTYQGNSELSTWLYGIAMNLVRNYLSRSPHRRYSIGDDEELAAMPSDAPSPEEALAQAQQMQHLQCALSDLPQTMQDVLMMVAVDELSYEEAAVLLSVPVGTVRSRLSRARTTLRARMLALGTVLDF